MFVMAFSFGQTNIDALNDLVEEAPDSIRNIAFKNLENQRDDSKKAAYHHLIARTYQSELDWDQAIFHLNVEDSLIQNGSPSLEEEVRNKHELANSYYQKGMLVLADSLLQETLGLASLSEDHNLSCEVLLDAGWLARERGRHAEALAHYFKAKQIAEATNDKELLAECYSKIAVVYHVKFEFETAQHYYDQSLALFTELGDYSKIGRLYNNYGLLYQYQGMSSKAVDYFERSIELCDSLDNQRGVAIANENLGILCYEDLENNTMALKRFKSSLDFWRSTNDIYGQSQTMVYMMFVYELQEDFLSLRDTGLRAVELSQEAGAKDVESDALLLLSKAYEGLGQTANAYSVFKDHITLKDSLQAINELEEIKILGIQSELASKQIKDSLNLAIQHEKNEAVIEQRVKDQEFWTIVSLGGVIALAFIVFLVFRGSQQRKKSSEQIEEANLLLKTKNAEIIDSITYAQRIQKAILPTKQTIEKHISESFVYYVPKDIVAGDFYWIEEVEEKGEKSILFAVADCTGHGVPGAMVSVICSNALNKAVNEMGIYEPSKILEEITKIVVRTFEKSDSELKDGMDISLVRIGEKKSGKIKLQYAGANNPLWVIKSNSKSVEETKATKRPIGKYAIDLPFKGVNYELAEGDMVYLFTDGYADQFGGERNKKFKYKTLKNFLVSIQDKSVEEQQLLLAETFNNWKGKMEQVDDVCIAGIRL